LFKIRLFAKRKHVRDQKLHLQSAKSQSAQFMAFCAITGLF